MLLKCEKLVCSGVVFLFSCLFLLVCAPAHAETAIEPVVAQENGFSKELRLGGQHYNQGEYAQAKAYFERALNQAQQQGKSAHTIYYNLGSVCYQLEQYDQSKLYFEKLLDHNKLKAVAYYNLALIENKKGNKKSTIDYLYQSKKVSTDSQLSKLVDQQLLKLIKQKPQRTKTVTYKDWHAYLYLSPGYDSNISFAPLEVASNESGSFLQFYGLFDKRIAGKGYGKKKSALLITSSVFLSNYFSTDFNDYSIFDIGLRYLLPVNKWRNTIELNIKKSTYGHDDYLRFHVATFKTKRRFSDGNTLRLRYRFEQINSLDQRFDHLEGYRQKLRLGYQFKWPSDLVDLWYELELNDRENLKTNTVDLNYSPTRNTFRLRYEKKFNATNRVYGELEYRHSDYDPTPSQDRADRRSGYLLAYVNDITRDWQLLARWGFRSTRSTESVFSHDRHIVLLTLRKSF
ncbi:MAG: tetratricopeptide repeat protein [Gammaproteobacteria bacterium]